MRQLRDLMIDLQHRADESGYLTGWVDMMANTCHIDTVNFYDVAKYFVKPRTARKKCSYVDRVVHSAVSGVANFRRLARVSIDIDF